MVETADIIWADGPAQAPSQPSKTEIRKWGKWIEGIIAAFLGNSGVVAFTRDQLFLFLDPDAFTMAWVVQDPIAERNGIYQRLGTDSPPWERVADLPYGFIIANDAGAGTPNAIQATTSIPVSPSALIWMTVADTTTAGPVTVQFNGGSVLTVKTNGGNDVVPGSIQAGMTVIGIVSGSTFRLLNDVATSALVTAAETYALQAQAAAAGVTLPSAVASTYLRQKADLSGYETRTPAQVAGDLNVQQRNIDGGFTMHATTTTQAWDNGRFGGGWFAAQRFSTEDNATTGGSRATLAVDRKVSGSGGNGPSLADLAAYFSSSKKNHLTSGIDGEVDVLFLAGSQGQKSDLGGILTDLEKVGGDTGGMVGNETALKWVDSSGVTVKRVQAILNYAGQGSGFYDSVGTNGIGFWAEAQIGTSLSAFMCDQAGAASFQNVIVATTGRSIGSIYYKVDSAGRTYGGNGSGASPTFSFISDPNTGVGRIGEDQLGFSAGGTYRFYVDAGAFVPAADNAYSLGRVSTGRVSNIYTVNAPTVGSDERLKTDILDSPLGLDFILGLRPVAYKLKQGGTVIEMVEDFEEFEEQETIEDDVIREEKYFDGAKVVTLQHHERGQIPVWEDPVQASDPKTGEPLFREVKVPRLSEDGLAIVQVIQRDPMMARSETGEIIEITQPPEIVPLTDEVREPVMQAVPKMRKVRKSVMRPVEVERAGNRQHFGLIAQEVQKALQGVDFGGHVIDDITDPESLQSLRYEQFVPILIKAVQELSARVKELER